MVLSTANLIGFGPGYEMVVDFFKVVVFKWICNATFILIYLIVGCGVIIMRHANYAQNVKGYRWNQVTGLEDEDRKETKRH